MKNRKQSLSFRNKKITFLLLSVGIFAGLGAFGYGLYKNKDITNTDVKSSAASNPLADLNADNNVNIQDLSILISKWGTNAQPADINKDGTVSIQDLSILISSWGPITITQAQAGAQLPINYSLASLTGTVRYISPTGNDTSGTGTVGAPYATLTKAESVSNNGDSIVVRGGNYQIDARKGVMVDRSVRIIAYPGEIPVFNGSVAAPTSVSTDGDLRFFSYQPIPASDGSGLSLPNFPNATFSGTTPTGLAATKGWRCVTGNNSYTAPTTPTGCSSPRVVTGYYPDQVWVGDKQLVQVSDKSLVKAGTFYVPRTSETDQNPGISSLYLFKDDAADMSKVRVSNSGGTIKNLDTQGGNTQGDFLRLIAPNITIEGIRIMGHSPALDSYAMRVMTSAVNTKVQNVEILSNNGVPIHFQVSKDTTLTNVSVLNSSWMGASSNYADNIHIYNSKLSYSNTHQEFGAGPVSGGFKLSKSQGTIIENSEFNYNYGYALWFDQSCYHTIVANSQFIGNSHAGVFYEISHDILVINNYIVAGSETNDSLRLAASSGLKIINNTIVGGIKSGIGIHADGRTKTFTYNGETRYCAEHASRYGAVPADYPSFEVACVNGLNSDIDKQRTGRFGTTNKTYGLNFQPSVDLLINNIVVKSSTYSCGNLCVVGYTYWWSSSNQAWVKASVMMDSIVHKTRTATLDDPAVGETVINGNLYQIPSGNIAQFSSGTGISGFTPLDTRTGATFTSNSITSLKNSLSASPYSIITETNGKSGTNIVGADGVVLDASIHTQASPVQSDATINKYISPGTRHYGVTYK